MKAALTKLVDAVGNAVYQRLAGSRLLRKRALGRYRKRLSEATGKISIPFRLNRPLILSDIYVALKVVADRDESARSAWEVLETHRRLVVTGPPGGGKSMLLRHLASSGSSPAGGALAQFGIPVLIELHRLGRPASQGTELKDYIVDCFQRYGFPRSDKFVRVALDRGWLILLLDGFDEVPSKERQAAAARIRDFLETERNCPAVITCRTAVYHHEFDSVCDFHVELEPFEDQQIQAFLGAWSDPMPAEKSPAQLMAALREQPQLLASARNPLLLTIITHLYSDSPTYVLPRSRAEFYRQAAMILLEQWQEHLHHNNFDGAEKRTLLASLAMRIQESGGNASADRRTISREDAIAEFSKVLPNLGRPETEAGDVLLEIVERSGLLIPVDGGTRYAFAHLTFQEYFAAEFLLNQPDEMLRRCESDRDTWREVTILWCGLVSDCTTLISRIRQVDPSIALACVAEAGAVDQALAMEIMEPMIELVSTGKGDEALQRSVGAVAADVRPRGSAVLEALMGALQRADSREKRECIAGALAASNQPRAAKAIVDLLTEYEDLQPALVRLGDLAVPGLEGIALEDGSRLVCQTLALIGTPAAGIALAKAIPVSRAAAWGFAAIIGNPLVASGVSNHAALRLAPRGHSPLAWIWSPFDRSDGRLAELVGQACEAILASRHEDIIVEPPVDARISVALCASEGSPLFFPVAVNSSGRHLATAVAGRLRHTTIEFDGQGAVLTARELDPMVRLEQRRGRQDGKRNGVLLSYGDLVQVAFRDFEHSYVRVADRSSVNDATTRREAIQKFGEDTDETIEDLLKALAPYPVYRALLNSMSPNFRKSFLGRAGRRSQVSRETWPAVVSKVPFRRLNSRWHAGDVLLLAVASVASCVMAVSLIVTSPLSLPAVLALLAIVSITGSWIWIFAESSPLRGGPAQVDIDAVLETVFGPLAAYEAIDNQLSGKGSPDSETIFTAGFSVSLLWLLFELLSSLGVSSLIAIGVLVAYFGVGIACFVVAISREDFPRIPLAGLFGTNGPGMETLWLRSSAADLAHSAGHSVPPIGLREGKPGP